MREILMKTTRARSTKDAPSRDGNWKQSDPVLDVCELRTHIDSGEKTIRAVDGVSLQCFRGRTLGVVGESGSGKTMTFLSAMGLLPSKASIVAGDIRFEGRSLLECKDAERRALRGRSIAMIFQDALTGLNPSFNVGTQIADIYRYHDGDSRRRAWKRALEVLDLVGIPDPHHRASFYPHQLSGGMRQRVMIAMGIALNPSILIADEPTTALDVTIQCQILDLLDRLRKELGMSLVLISHDLGLVARYAEEVAIMYAGTVVEYADVRTIFYQSRHPYSIALQHSVPRPDQDSESLTPIPGQPAQPSGLPSGCSFYPRCSLTQGREECLTTIPNLRRINSDEHVTACHFAEELEREPLGSSED